MIDYIKQNERRDIFRHSLFIGASLLIVYLLICVFSVGISLIFEVLGYSGEQLNKFLTDTWSGYLVQTLLSAVLYTFPFLLIKKACKKNVYEICSFNTPTNRYSFFCIGFVLGITVISNFLTSIFNIFLKEYFNFEAVQSTIGDSAFANKEELIYTIVAAALLPALVEEFAFRGMILGALRKFGDMPAVIFSALVFALFHRNFIQIPFALIVGIALGITVVITNSIWPAIIAHFLNNFFAVIANALPDDQMDIVGLLFLLMLAFGIMSFIFLVKTGGFKNIKKKKNKMNSISKFLTMISAPTTVIFIVLTIFEALLQRV